MSFFFAMKKGDDDENKFSPPTPKIIEPFLLSLKKPFFRQIVNPLWDFSYFLAKKFSMNRFFITNLPTCVIIFWTNF